MKNEILLLELKRMRHKVKIATEKTEIAPVAPEDEIEVIEEEESGAEPFFQSPVNWTGPDLHADEWDDDTTTSLSKNPTSDQKYHMTHSEAARGMFPGTGGMMTDEARRKGLERLRQDRPELFDPKKIKEMKKYQQSYHVYYDSYLPDDRRNKFNEMMLASKGYTPVKLEAELANQLSGLMGDYLVGKSITISTGSPTLPREETVTILDVDPDSQTIIFKPVGKGPKLFSSYDDFFYNTVGRRSGKSDGEKALMAAAPEIQMPSKGGPLSRGWKNLLKILPPWAKA